MAVRKYRYKRHFYCTLQVHVQYRRSDELRRLACMNIVKNGRNSKIMVFKLVVNYYVLVTSGNHYIHT